MVCNSINFCVVVLHWFFRPSSFPTIYSMHHRCHHFHFIFQKLNLIIRFHIINDTLRFFTDSKSCLILNLPILFAHTEYRGRKRVFFQFALKLCNIVTFWFHCRKIIIIIVFQMNNNSVWESSPLLRFGRSIHMCVVWALCAHYVHPQNIVKNENSLQERCTRSAHKLKLIIHTEK